MSRLDELTLRLADGDLSQVERTELEELIRRNPDAILDHAAMLDLVASLRGDAPATGQADPTLARIHERITEKIEVGVLQQIRARGPVARRGTRRAAPARSRAWIWQVAAAGIAMVLLVLALRTDNPDERVTRRVEPKSEQPPVEHRPEPPPPAPKPVPPKVEELILPKRVPSPSPVPLPEPAPAVPIEEKKPEPKPAPPPETPKPALPPTETVVVVAVLEKGDGALVAKKPAKAGQEILEGQGLDADNGAVVKFADGTRLELRPKTQLRDFSVKTGKSVEIARGILIAQVAEQPADRPMTIVTPQAEIRVVGTALRVSVDPEADGATSVDVSEGKVRVRRLADAKTVDVSRGATVMVAKGVGPLAAQLQTGLVAHWKLDEAAGTAVLDSSGNLFHGKLQGDATWVAGRTGGGVRFAATGHLALQGFKAPDAFTVSFWVYQAKLSTDQDWFVNFGGNEFMFMREGNMDRRQIRTGFENPQEFLTVASVIQAAQWTHFAVTCDGAEIRVYANGMPSGNRKITRREFKPDATFGRVGAGSEAVMDDIRIYDRAVPATDIPRIMAGLHPAPAGRR